MKNYLNLNLTNEPLKEKDSILAKYLQEERGYSLEDPSILKDEVLEYFYSRNLIPDFVVIFNAKINGQQERRFLHSDVVYNAVTKSWNHITCGVNWDIQGVGTFQWWKLPDNIKHCYPGEPAEHGAYSKFSGVHFERRGKVGIPEGAILLDVNDTSKPMLVRTDIPHSVIFNIPRTCVSLRFKDTIDKDWSEIYTRFNENIGGA